MKLTVVGIVSIVAAIVLSASAQAAVPPDSCFDFDSTTGTINTYYRNENNSGTAPQCPVAVDVPPQISAVPVVSIGNSAFERGGSPEGVKLTAVTFPATVTQIGNLAFAGNRLTNVSFPGNVTRIGVSAFLDNRLTSIDLPAALTEIEAQSFSNNRLRTVSIPDSVIIIADGAFAGNKLGSLELGQNVQTIGSLAFAANLLDQVILPSSVVDISQVAFIINTPNETFLEAITNNALSDPNEITANVRYVQLFTAVRTSLQDQAYTEDGGNGSVVNGGGHLINPAAVRVQYQDTAGQVLRQSQRRTALLADGRFASTYMVADGPAIALTADPSAPTSAEEAAWIAALSVYGRIGQQISVDAPAIANYTLQTPSPSQVTLADADNEFVFRYVLSGAQAESAPPLVPGAPRAGLTPTSARNINSMIIAATVVIVLIGALSFVVTRRVWK